MAESSISKLKSFSSVINLDEFIDYTIQIGILNKETYWEIWNKPKEYRLNELFNKIDEKGLRFVQTVQQHLSSHYPNIEEIVKDEENFRKSTIRGNFPKLPPFCIKRKYLASLVKHHLEALKWHETLVVYGMVGYGKSCLVNEVLHDKVLAKHFDYQIYWINLGEDSPENCLIWLYERACQSVNKAFSFENINSLRENVKHLFLEPSLKNALIILDDVCNSQVLKLFDLGCKRVVITQDKNVLGNETAYFVEVKIGFLWKEALELFKLSLNSNEELPIEAERIYDLCKGHPMLIGLIALYLSKNVYSGNNLEIWCYIETKILGGDYRLYVYDESPDVISEKIKAGIDKLNYEELILKFKDLAIFPEDVNIPPSVLKILWDTNDTDVRNIMNKFCEKSLVKPSYSNRDGKSIYGIHVMHSKYLKEEMKEQLSSVHKRLIDGYDKVTIKNYALLPNDNYSFYFIEYHLYHARVFDKFQIYFDLFFLQAKIKIVGKDGVLQDMDKYRDYITGKDALLDNILSQLKEFVRKCGANLFNFQKTDIIQYALQEKKDSLAYGKALTHAANSHRLYFKYIRLVKEDMDDFQRINTSDDITCVAFVNSVKHILLGFSSGKIKLFYGRYEKEISTFSGHSSPIQTLIVSPDKKYFLSLGEEGLVRLWKLSSSDKRHSFEFIGSPQTTQANWQDLFSPENTVQSPENQFELSGDYIVSAAFYTEFPKLPYIATGSKMGFCVVWDIKTGLKVLQLKPVGYSFSCVCFTPKELIYSYDDHITIYRFSVINGECKADYGSSLYNKYKVKKFFRYRQELMVVGQNNIRLWNLNLLKFVEYRPKMALDEHYLCSALTCDSAYLILSTRSGKIYFWDVAKKETIGEIKSEGLTRSLDTFYDEDKTFHVLLIGSDRKTLQQCFIYPYNSSSELCCACTPPFMAHWKKNQPYFLLVSCADNRIQVYRGYSLISETNTIRSKITRLCFSACGNYVIYGLITGDIWTFNIKNKSYSQLPPIKTRGSINFLNCYDNDNYSIHNLLDNLNMTVDVNVNVQDFSGVVVAVCDNNIISVHKNNSLLLCSSVNKPTLFTNGDCFILVEQDCTIRKLDLRTNLLTTMKSHLGYGKNTLVTLSTVAFCVQKNYLVLSCNRVKCEFLDLVQLEDDQAILKDSLEVEDPAMSCCISPDGSLIAAGFCNGDILIWETEGQNYTILPKCHDDSVDQLIFSPSIEPILISLSEEVSFWNLKPIKQSAKPMPHNSKPKSIDILNVTQHQCNMDIAFWSSRKPYEDGYLLSCLRFNAKPTYLSASSDFSTFLVLDEKGKIYIIETFEHG